MFSVLHLPHASELDGFRQSFLQCIVAKLTNNSQCIRLQPPPPCELCQCLVFQAVKVCISWVIFQLLATQTKLDEKIYEEKLHFSPFVYTIHIYVSVYIYTYTYTYIYIYRYIYRYTTTGHSDFDKQLEY
jgi:hypothetical protein